LWREGWTLKFGRCRPNISPEKGYRLSSIGKVWVLLPTRIIGIEIWIMVWPRLRAIHTGYMLNKGRGKRVPNSAIFSHIYHKKGMGHMNSQH